MPVRTACLLLALFVAVACQRSDPLADSQIGSPPRHPAAGDWTYHGDRRSYGPQSAVLSTLTPRGQHALLILANATGFTAEALGVGGTLSPHAEAFRHLLAEPHTLAAFLELAHARDTSAKLYGLSGLYLLDPPTYQSLANTLRHNNTPVVTQIGCIILTRTVSDIVGHGTPRRWEIESGVWPRALAGRPY
jgi:hypothetical protein